MEDRVESKPAERPGAALFALAAIVAITAGWWALALWPVGSVEPEWLARTRSACFGSHGGGLPDAGGWILLVGEPLGMTAVLFILWGHSLRRNLEWVWMRRAWRLAAAFSAVMTLVFFTTLGLRVARAQASPSGIATGSGISIQTDFDAPSIDLVDQRGETVALSKLRGSPTLLTFAYGHCSAVCPSIVTDLRIVRQQSPKQGVRIAILTLDPWRDVPERLPMLSTHWKLAASDVVLSGAVQDVQTTLDALGIGRKRNETTGDIDHGTTVMLLDSRGRVRFRVDGGAREDFAALLKRAN